MTHMENINRLAEIIHDYRQGEIGFDLNQEHIEKWISQFTQESQDIILEEMVYIFENWYFSKEKIIDGLKQIFASLQKQYFLEDVKKCIEKISFINDEQFGRSQQMLISWLEDYVKQEYSEEIRKGILSVKHHVYIDDGVFTGNQSKKNLEFCLDKLPKESTLDVFFLVAANTGYNYVQKKIEEYAKEKNITVNFYVGRLFSSRKFCNRYENGDIYTSQPMTLWPFETLQNMEKIENYCNSFEHFEHFEFCPYRIMEDSGIFSSPANRYIVEKEFLLKGIEILKQCYNQKGLYPLGYNIWPPFGFGSCAIFEMNISYKPFSIMVGRYRSRET